MSEESKSIWKKSWTGWGWLWAWLILVVATFCIVLIISLLVSGGLQNLGATLASSAAISAVAIVFVGLLVFIHWVCSWKNFRRFLFGLACFATLVALFYAEEDWRGWHDWNQFKSKWEAKGEKFGWQSVVPPPVPDDQNFALTPIVASSYGQILDRHGHRISPPDTDVVDRMQISPVLNYRDWPIHGAGNWEEATVTDLKPWQNYYRKLAARTNFFPVAPHPQSPAADVLLALSKYDPVIEELRRASHLPYSRFPLNYDTDQPWTIVLPHLASLKPPAQVLQLRAIAELQAHQSQEALDDIKLMLRLDDSVRSEPDLIAHLIRIAILQMTLQPIYEGLAGHHWSDAQLAELDSELAKLDFLADYKLAMRGERACNLSVIDYLRRFHNPLRMMRECSSTFSLDSNSKVKIAMVVLTFGPSGWLDQNELRIARFETKWYLPLADETDKTVSPDAVRATDAAVSSELAGHWTPENVLEAWLLRSLGPAVEKFAYAQESVDLARVAIALERYRLANGSYPESLDALAPRFIAKVPHDVIGGGPLHYRLTSDGQFVLYSIGWNERDDGGVVVLRKGSATVDINRGDWVWRYPAR